MAKWFQPFSFGCKTYKRSEGRGQTKHPSDLLKITANNPENIRESILDFTAHFGEINPDMPYLQTRSVGAKKGCFCLFSLCLERADEKKLNL